MLSSARNLPLNFPPQTIDAVLDYLRIIDEMDPAFFETLSSGIAPAGRFFHDLLINQQRHPMDHRKLHFLAKRPVDFAPFRDCYILIDKDTATPTLLYVRSAKNGEIVVEDVKIRKPVKFKEALAKIHVLDLNPRILSYEDVQSLITAHCKGHNQEVMIKDVWQKTPIDGFVGRLNTIELSYDVNTIKELHKLRYCIYLEVFSAHEGRRLLLSLTKQFSSSESDKKVKNLITSLGFILTFGLMNVLSRRNCMSSEKQDFINRVFNSSSDALSTLNDLLNGDKGVLLHLFNGMDTGNFARFLNAHDEAALLQDANAKKKAMQLADSNAHAFLNPLKTTLKELFTARSENNLLGKRELFSALKELGVLHLNKKLLELLDTINAIPVKSTESKNLKKSLLAKLAVVVIECIKADYRTIRAEELSLDEIKSIQDLISKAGLYYKDNCAPRFRNAVIEGLAASLADDYTNKHKNLVDKIRTENQQRIDVELKQEKKEKKEKHKKHRKHKKHDESRGSSAAKNKRHSVAGFTPRELKKAGIQLHIPGSSRTAHAHQSSAGHTPPLLSSGQNTIRKRASSDAEDEKRKPSSEPVLILRRTSSTRFSNEKGAVPASRSGLRIPPKPAIPGTASADQTPASSSRTTSSQPGTPCSNASSTSSSQNISQTITSHKTGTPEKASPKGSPKSGDPATELPVARSLSTRMLDRFFGKRPASPGPAARRNQQSSPLSSARPVHFQELPTAGSNTNLIQAASASSSASEPIPPVETSEEIRNRKRNSNRHILFAQLNGDQRKTDKGKGPSSP